MGVRKNVLAVFMLLALAEGASVSPDGSHSLETHGALTLTKLSSNEAWATLNDEEKNNMIELTLNLSGTSKDFVLSVADLTSIFGSEFEEPSVPTTTDNSGSTEDQTTAAVPDHSGSTEDQTTAAGTDQSGSTEDQTIAAGTDHSGSTEDQTTATGTDHSESTEDQTTATETDHSGSIEDQTTATRTDQSGSIEDQTTAAGTDQSGSTEDQTTATGTDHSGPIEDQSTPALTDHSVSTDDQTTASVTDHSGSTGGPKTETDAAELVQLFARKVNPEDSSLLFRLPNHFNEVAEGSFTIKIHRISEEQDLTTYYFTMRNNGEVISGQELENHPHLKEVIQQNFNKLGNGIVVSSVRWVPASELKDDSSIDLLIPLVAGGVTLVLLTSIVYLVRRYRKVSYTVNDCIPESPVIEMSQISPTFVSTPN